MFLVSLKWVCYWNQRSDSRPVVFEFAGVDGGTEYLKSRWCQKSQGPNLQGDAIGTLPPSTVFRSAAPLLWGHCYGGYAPLPTATQHTPKGRMEPFFHCVD